MKNMESSLNKTQKAILSTLLYSDIFDFPLTKEEIWRFLISKQKISRKKFEEGFAALQTTKKITSQNNSSYYCLSRRVKILRIREENLLEVSKKLNIATRAASYLSYIPTVKFIGISGGLAIGSVKQEDDIDFFIITKKNTLFITRIVILALLEMLQLRRSRTETNPANKICVNLLMEETVLQWPVKKQDLYTAHEIAQVLPLFERESMYSTFLTENIWIEKFLPNALQEIKTPVSVTGERAYYSLKAISSIITIPPLESLVKALQKRLIQRHKTRETVGDHFLAFHPIDYGAQTLQSLRKKTRLLGLLTKG